MGKHLGKERKSMGINEKEQSLKRKADTNRPVYVGETYLPCMTRRIKKQCYFSLLLHLNGTLMQS